MIVSFVIALREGLEAALIVGIVFAFLVKTNRRSQFKQVYLGVITAIVVSVIFALIFQWVAGGFTGQSEQIFEGVTTLIAAGLLTTMIIWMERSAPNIKQELEQKVEKSTFSPSLGVFFIIFVAVLREGVETVFFLFGLPVDDSVIWLGALLGFLVAVVLAAIYFFSSKRFSLQTFFRVTSVILVIFAAGMVAYGVHELQEASVFPTVIEHVWDINHLLDESSPLGQILKGLIGYNGNPSLLEVGAYLSYVAIMATYFILRQKKYRIHSSH